MAEKKVQDTDSIETLHKIESTFQKYQKQILGGVGAILVIVVGWYAYQGFVVQPKEEQAADAIFKAEGYFAQDSLSLALNGDGKNKGFLYIINNYGSTKSGALAKYYAGLCYLRTGDYNNAVKYLQDFHTDAAQIQMMAYGALGDAYSELKKNEEAVANYKKAAATFEKDEANAAEYLFRAGLLLETMGKTTEAVEAYKEIKEKYPQTDKGFQVDKYLYRMSIEPNDFSVK